MQQYGLGVKRTRFDDQLSSNVIKKDRYDFIFVSLPM